MHSKRSKSQQAISWTLKKMCLHILLS